METWNGQTHSVGSSKGNDEGGKLMNDKLRFNIMNDKLDQLKGLVADLQAELEIKNEFISQLGDELKGNVRAIGFRYCKDGEWQINTSSILDSLIKTAAKHCDSYASDVFINWKFNVDKPLYDGTIETSTIMFGFRDMGVDGNERYEYHKDDHGYYKEVWFLDVMVDGNKLTMTLHK